jgi:hypothetical protein
MRISLGFWKMAYRNENGYIRPVNTMAPVTTTGTASGDTDRSVNWINIPVDNYILFFFPKFLDKRAIQELIKEVDPMMQIDEEVEDVCFVFQLFIFQSFLFV